MENLEEYSTVMEEKITRFDDVIDRLKSEIFNVEKKEVAKVRQKENTLNIFQEEMFRRRYRQSLKSMTRELKLSMRRKLM